MDFRAVFYCGFAYKYCMTYLAVFDWNATLLDDMDATHKGTNACLEFFDRPTITREQEQELFTFPLIHFYEKMGVNAATYLERAEEAGEVFSSVYREEKKTCGLKTGAEDVLKWLTAQGVQCIVLSNYLQPFLSEDVTAYGIADYFHTISGNTDPATLVAGLSKQKRLEEFVEQNGFERDKTFIIGDSHEEPELAKRMGIMGISISGGLLSKERLKTYAADYVVDELPELKAILHKEWALEI